MRFVFASHLFRVNLLRTLPDISDINNVIMDYLIKEGYPDAARKFAIEAKIPEKTAHDDEIRTRVEIRNAIHAAIVKINELNPEVSTRPCLPHPLL